MRWWASVCNTLSENGSVARGVCAYNDKRHLTDVVERTEILRIDGIIKCSLAHQVTVEAQQKPVVTSLAKAVSGRRMKTTNSISFSSYRQLPHGFPERGLSVRFLFLYKTFHEMETIKLLNHLQ